METSTFISGAVMAVMAAIGFHFFRFWKQTRDRFFILFAFAFWLFSVERIPILFFQADISGKSEVYLIRLVAFILILAAIVGKNRSRENTM